MSNNSTGQRTRLSPQQVRALKGQRGLSMVTAYDFNQATLAEAAGLDMILVGDSLGMVMLGEEDTLGVTVDIMAHHCRAVTRAAVNTLVVADMPFLSYEPGVETALAAAGRLFREGGARAVKLEGAGPVLPQVRALVNSGIPVMGHLGLTPQRAYELGGFKVQGKSLAAAKALLQDALDLEAAGCFAVVLECIPAALAAKVTARLSIPTIGIGAGAACDGQVLVWHDLLGLQNTFSPKFVKKYGEFGQAMVEALQKYHSEVAEGSFPGPEHEFSMPAEILAELEAL